MKNFKEFVENYGNITEESFIDTYLKDKEVFGEETKGLYEDVLSEIIGEDVDLQDFDDAIEEDSFTKLPNFSNKAMNKLDWDRKVAERELNDKDLRDLNKALEYALGAKNISEEVLDKNHHTLATPYSNLSIIYKALVD